MTRDKILIVCDNRSLINDRLETLFKRSLPIDQNIIRSVQWRNKYYDVEFDVYIDEIDTSLQDWIMEFNSEQCDALREVLAGVIFILPFNSEGTLNTIASKLRRNNNNKSEEDRAEKDDDEDFFIVCCDTVSNERYPYWDDFTKIEVTTFTTSQERNKNGEYEGIKRVGEIIDVYPWSHLQLKKKPLLSGAAQNQDLKDNIDMQGVISKLKLAKLEYSKNKDESLALKTSEEIAKLISNAI